MTTLNHTYTFAAFAWVALLSTTLAVACDPKQAEAKDSVSESEPVVEAKAGDGKPASDTAVSKKRAALARYEGVRAALAKDALMSTTVEAAALEEAARSVAEGLSGTQRQLWINLVDTANQLKNAPKDNADAVRKLFGEVSKSLLAMLTADRALAEGLHVFECPMAQGYGKWVQSAAKISNPYMGGRMPECGSESTL